jgi:hypothetical protein
VAAEWTITISNTATPLRESMCIIRDVCDIIHLFAWIYSTAFRKI